MDKVKKYTKVKYSKSLKSGKKEKEKELKPHGSYTNTNNAQQCNNCLVCNKPLGVESNRHFQCECQFGCTLSEYDSVGF
jgi:hypothetical protein